MGQGQVSLAEASETEARAEQEGAASAASYRSNGSNGMQFPEKYRPLRVLSQPEGRDFVARPFVDKEGRRRVRIDSRVEAYEL